MKQVFIVGFGKFGKLALTHGGPRWGKARIWIIDSRPEAFKDLNVIPSSGIKVLADGPRFLTLFQNWIGDEDLIIPALPIHLAWNWLLLNLINPKRHRSIKPPKSLGAGLPFNQISRNGLFLSYADFLCPENCPAPLHYCFKTKEKRAVPLWKLLAEKKGLKGSLGVIESRQMAPGLGGFAFKELRRIRDLARRVDPPFFVATACRCHGVIHGLTWENKSAAQQAKGREVLKKHLKRKG